MHLLPLLSAIAALCLTQLAVGLPHPQEQEKEQQSDSNTLDEVTRYLGAIGIGAAGAGLFNWNNHKKTSKKLDDLQNGQNNLQNGQTDLKNGQNDLKNGQNRNNQKLGNLQRGQEATQRQVSL